MQNKGNVFTSLVVLVLGVVLFWGFDRTDVMRTIVIITAVAFIVPAVVDMLLLVGRSSEKQQRSMGGRAIEMVCCIGALALGVVMLVNPEKFTLVMVYVFGFTLVACGLFQLFMLVKGYRPIVFPGWMYVAPLMVLVGGVVVLLLPDLKDPDNTRTVLLVTAIGLIMTAITGLLMSVGAASFAKRLTRSMAEKTRQLDEKSAKPAAPDAAATGKSALEGVEAKPASDVGGDHPDQSIH